MLPPINAEWGSGRLAKTASALQEIKQTKKGLEKPARLGCIQYTKSFEYIHINVGDRGSRENWL